MSATGLGNQGGGISAIESLVMKPPAHPTYDLKEVIKLALSEDAGDRGPFSSLLSTFPNFYFFLK